MTPKTLTKKATTLCIALLGVMGACGKGDETAHPLAPVDSTATTAVLPVTAPAETARETPAGDLPETNDPPQKALEITDPNVVPYGVRIRVTHGAWEFLRLTLRDAFKQWGSPKRDLTGFNLLLDPGYDAETKSAGPIRTTPLVHYYAHRPGFGCAFGDCPGANLLKPRPGSKQWLQIRKYEPPGQGNPCNTDNTVSENDRGVIDTTLQALQREHGFYVTKGNQCFTEINVCTPGSKKAYISRPHAGHDPEAECTMEAIETKMDIKAEVNLGIFIYPHGGVESKPTGVEPYAPAYIGTYTGLSNQYGLRKAGPRTVSDRCFFGRCRGSKSGWWWVTSDFPSSEAEFDIFAYQFKDEGSYLYPGDDQAIYLNVNQMQI